MQGGDQPDRRRMAFLGFQALVIAGRRPFRRPGRFVLGLLDVIVAWRRCGILRRLQPRQSLTSPGGRPCQPATTGERQSHFRRVDICQ